MSDLIRDLSRSGLNIMFQRLAKSDCGDSSCIFTKDRTGMRTNGGCRCYQNYSNEIMELIEADRKRIVDPLKEYLDMYGDVMSARKKKVFIETLKRAGVNDGRE